MLVLNFSHPLSDSQLEQIRKLSGRKTTKVVDLKVQFDGDRPYAEQVAALIDGVDLSSQQWQNEPILINPPSFNFAALALLAELHGRMGHFPPCLRLRPVPNSMPPQFEVAEILDLTAIRERARQRR